MNKPDYTYEFHPVQFGSLSGKTIDIPILSIVDQDLGNVSVTNAMEHVLSEIFSEEPYNPFIPIVYLDSTGTWDMVLITNVRPIEVAFMLVGTDSLEDALDHAAKRYRWMLQNNAHAIVDTKAGQKYRIAHQDQLLQLLDVPVYSQ